MTAPTRVRAGSSPQRARRHVGALTALSFVALAVVAGDARAQDEAKLAKAATACQVAIAKAGAQYLTARIKALDKCATAELACIQQSVGDAACMTAARAVCTAAVAGIASADGKFRSAVERACSAVPDDRLLGPAGVGYQALAEQCGELGGMALTTRAAVVDCVLRAHARITERLFSFEQARARELLLAGGVDVAAFPDLTVSTDGCETCGTGEPESAKALVSCARTLTKAGAVFAVKTLTASERCATATFACAIRQPVDPSCLERARGVCAKQSADSAARRQTLRDAIAKRCAPVAFATLRAPGGLDVGALDDECEAAAGAPASTLEAYALCVRRQHEIQIAELLHLAAPRVDEVLSSLALDRGSVVCPGGPTEAAVATASFSERATPFAFGGIRRFLSRVFRPIGRRVVSGVYNPGGARLLPQGGNGGLRVTAGRSSARPGGADTLSVMYRGGGGPFIRGSGRGTDASPALVVTTEPQPCLLDDFFEIPIALPPGTTEATTTVDVEFPDDLASAAVPLRMALRTADGITPFVPVDYAPKGGPLRRVKDINPGPDGSFPFGFRRLGNSIIFAADDGTHGTELWKTDGTAAGTVMIADLTPGPESSGIYPNLTEVKGTLYFSAFAQSEFGLWRTDGTEAGTMPVIAFGRTSESAPAELTAVGDTLFFGNGVTQGSRTCCDVLWKTDGTADGTQIVRSGFTFDFEHLSGLAASNGTLFFAAFDDDFATELWRSNGTFDGTFVVKDIAFEIPHNPFIFGPASFPANLTDVNGVLFFTATDAALGGHGRELWKSDGTMDGTVMVRDINPGPGSITDGPLASLPLSNLTNAGGTLYFTANDGTTGEELWKTDGTFDGTARVADIAPGPSSSAPRQVTVVGNTVFFTANDGTTGRELWKTTVGTLGATRVRDILPGSQGSNPFGLIAVENTLFFSATDGLRGVELFESDGSDAGTRRVRDILPGSDSTTFFSLDAAPAALDGTLFFHSDDGVAGDELWALTK